MLVEEREEWRKLFESESMDISLPYLEAYKNNRDSESWRMSKEVEKLCEYICYLEEKIYA